MHTKNMHFYFLFSFKIFYEIQNFLLAFQSSALFVYSCLFKPGGEGSQKVEVAVVLQSKHSWNATKYLSIFRLFGKNKIKSCEGYLKTDVMSAAWGIKTAHWM